MSAPVVNLGPQLTNWIPPQNGGPEADDQLDAYTGTWTTTPPGSPQSPYKIVAGYNGAIYVQIIEGNVGTATLEIEGSLDNVLWRRVAYSTVVSAGTTQTTFTRTVAALSVALNSDYYLQLLDAWPLMRVRPTANTGSITASFYCIAA